jgi:hypothetical protein
MIVKNITLVFDILKKKLFKYINLQYPKEIEYYYIKIVNTLY